jgi:hypothetical protein
METGELPSIFSRRFWFTYEKDVSIYPTFPIKCFTGRNPLNAFFLGRGELRQSTFCVVRKSRKLWRSNPFLKALPLPLRVRTCGGQVSNKVSSKTLFVKTFPGNFTATASKLWAQHSWFFLLVYIYNCSLIVHWTNLVIGIYVYIYIYKHYANGIHVRYNDLERPCRHTRQNWFKFISLANIIQPIFKFTFLTRNITFITKELYFL